MRHIHLTFLCFGIFIAGLWGQREIALLNTPVRSLTVAAIVADAHITVPFELDRGMIYVQAEVDGSQGQFILDTGAPGLVLNEQPHPTTDNPYTAQSSGDAVAIGVKKVGLFEWAGRKMKKVEAITLDMDHLEQVHQSPIKGMIGYDLLKDYLVFLDYSRQQLIISTNGALPLKPTAILPFELDGHLPVLSVVVNGQTLRLGLDTGAAANLLDTKWKHLLPNPASDTVSDVQGLDQSVQRVPVVELSGIQVQQHAFDGAFLLLSLDHVQTTSGQPLDGLLGYPFLSGYQVAIDYKGGRLLLW